MNPTEIFLPGHITSICVCLSIYLPTSQYIIYTSLILSLTVPYPPTSSHFLTCLHISSALMSTTPDKHLAHFTCQVNACCLHIPSAGNLSLAFPWSSPSCPRGPLVLQAVRGRCVPDPAPANEKPTLLSQSSNFRRKTAVCDVPSRWSGGKETICVWLNTWGTEVLLREGRGRGIGREVLGLRGSTETALSAPLRGCSGSYKRRPVVASALCKCECRMEHCLEVESVILTGGFCEVYFEFSLEKTPEEVLACAKLP